MKFRRRAFVVFEGGLGNQLFQFAAAASVAGVEGVRVIETRPTPHVTLDAMVPGLVRRSGIVDQWHVGTVFAAASGWRGFVRAALKPVRSRVAARTFRPGGDLDHAFAHRPAGLNPLVLDGYFQHPDWFEPAKTEIVDRILAVAPAGLRDGSDTDREVVVVVVRGGDYIELGWQLEMDFYERALLEFKRPTSFRIVTDDQSRGDEVAAVLARNGWTRTMSERKMNSIDDFWAIAGARRVVMANSTFCWWAATVGDRLFGPNAPERLVVFPEHWVLGYGWVLAQPTWRSVTSGKAFVADNRYPHYLPSVDSLRGKLRAAASAYGVDLRQVRLSFSGRKIYRQNKRDFERLRARRPSADDFPTGNAWPCLTDRFDDGGVARGHYFHQDLLVAQWIYEAGPERHVDVGSRVDGFVAHVASFRQIEVLDIRPARSSATGITFHQRDIMVEDSTWDSCCDSLSCLHTIEHFGLGRYGDQLDPDGWRVGWQNLVRMVRPGGTIYLSTMIGSQRLEFDAHRVFALPTLIALVRGECEIESVALVDDSGELQLDLDHTGPSASHSFHCEAGCVILRLRRRSAT